LQRDQFGCEEFHQQHVVGVDCEKQFFQIRLIIDSVELREFLCRDVASLEFLPVNHTKNHVPLREEHFDARVLSCEQPMIQRVDCSRSDVGVRPEHFSESVRFQSAAVEELK
jgi:hypothetical protein